MIFFRSATDCSAQIENLDAEINQRINSSIELLEKEYSIPLLSRFLVELSKLLHDLHSREYFAHYKNLCTSDNIENYFMESLRVCSEKLLDLVPIYMSLAQLKHRLVKISQEIPSALDVKIEKSLFTQLVDAVEAIDDLAQTSNSLIKTTASEVYQVVAQEMVTACKGESKNPDDIFELSNRINKAISVDKLKKISEKINTFMSVAPKRFMLSYTLGLKSSESTGSAETKAGKFFHVDSMLTDIQTSINHMVHPCGVKIPKYVVAEWIFNLFCQHTDYVLHKSSRDIYKAVTQDTIMALLRDRIKAYIRRPETVSSKVVKGVTEILAKYDQKHLAILEKIAPLTKIIHHQISISSPEMLDKVKALQLTEEQLMKIFKAENAVKNNDEKKDNVKVATPRALR